MSISLNRDHGHPAENLCKTDRDECLRYVHEQVFKLRPKNYGRDYPKWLGLLVWN